MSLKFKCPQCGNFKKENSAFCEFCGTFFTSEIKLEKVTPALHDGVDKEEKEKKKESKFILNQSQRGIFLKKILPHTIIGVTLLLTGDIIFQILFSRVIFNSNFITIYIVFIVMTISLFITFHVTAKKNTIDSSIVAFYFFAFLAGTIGLPVHLLNAFLSLRVHMFIVSSLEAVLIVGLVAVTLRDKYFAKGYFLIHASVFILYLALAEIFFVLIFNIQNFLLTIPILTAEELAVSLTIMFYGAKITKIREKEPWTVILSKLVLITIFVFLSVIIYAVIILIIIVLCILLDGMDFDFSSLDFLNIFAVIEGGSPEKKKKKQPLNK